MYQIHKTDKPDHEMALNVIKYSLESGIKVDRERILSLIEEKSKIAKDAMYDLQLEYELKNPNSSKQVIDVILNNVKEDDLHLCSQQGKISGNKTTLTNLSLRGYKFADYIIKYRKAQKVIETCNNLLNYSDSAGYIHPHVERGVTNRLNYSSPALMNIPKSILWEVIIPTDKNMSLYSVDIKQQEPWVLVNLLEIEELKKLLEEHKDFYRALYYAAFGEDCTEEQREEVKRAWNAMSYGASQPSVVMYCTKFDGHKLYNYFNSIKEYKQYRGRAIGLAKKGVHSLDTYFGTKLYAVEAGNKLRRVLMNIPIQGTGSDILSLLIEHFYNVIDENNVQGINERDLNIYYTRHDELIIQVSNKFTEDSVIAFLKSIFTHQIDDWLPFEVEVSKVSIDNIKTEDEEEI